MLYAINCILYTVNYILYTIHYILHNQLPIPSTLPQATPQKGGGETRASLMRPRRQAHIHRVRGKFHAITFPAGGVSDAAPCIYIHTYTTLRYTTPHNTTLHHSSLD